MEMVAALTIPPHSKIDIVPGGYHFMLEEPKHTVKPGGGLVRLRLKFSDGEVLETPFAVRSPAQAK